MFTDTKAARELFEAHVPHADATFLVLKAQLVLEATLLRFIEARLPPPLAKEIVESRDVGFAARVLVARALASRDEVPIENADILWPALKYLGALRNQLAHNLIHEGSSIQDRMRQFVQLVDSSGGLFGTEWTDDHLFFVFRESSSYLNSLLTIVRAPISASEL